MSNEFMILDVTTSKKSNFGRITTTSSPANHGYATRNTRKQEDEISIQSSRSSVIFPLLQQLYSGPLPISIAKKKDLINLCNKSVISEEYHGWFQSLATNRSILIEEKYYRGRVFPEFLMHSRGTELSNIKRNRLFVQMRMSLEWLDQFQREANVGYLYLAITCKKPLGTAVSTNKVKQNLLCLQPKATKDIYFAPVLSKVERKLFLF